MSDLIRIRSHPDPALVILDTPPRLAEHMGKLEAARYDRDLGAYLLHTDALPSLTNFARFTGVHLVDQRATNGPRPVPQECQHCAQPGSWSNPPKFCPACGAKWDPTPPPTDQTTNRRDYRRCPSCNHGNTGRGDYCTQCGNPLDLATLDLRPEEPRPIPTDRARLDNPERIDPAAVIQLPSHTDHA